MIPIDIIQDVKDQSVTFHVKVDIAKGSQSNGGSDIGHMMLDNIYPIPILAHSKTFRNFDTNWLMAKVKSPLAIGG